VFIPVLKDGFQVFDESGELLLNAHVNSGLGWQNLRWSFSSLGYSNWYPLTWISHMLDFSMFGAPPWGHHLTNMLLHAANGVLLFLALNNMTGAVWRSLVVAGLFALHPLRVESVAWITERKDVLSAFFGLLALLAYARYAKESKIQSPKSKVFYGLTLLLFACGLMSKSMLVTFPFLLLLLDYWPLNRVRNSELGNGNVTGLLLEKIPFFLLVVPVSIAVCMAQKGGGQFLLHFPLSFRLETAVMGYARYLGKMFWPADFSVLYPYPNSWPVGELMLAAALILGITIAVFAWRRQRPYVMVGWLWYLGTLVPVIGLVPLGAQSMSNRYTYIPMMGVLLLVVWSAGDLSRNWRWRTVILAAIAASTMGACIFRTRAEIVYWKSSETLWRRATEVTKNNFMAHYCLGLILSRDNPDVALAEYQKSAAAYPDYADVQREFGVLLSKRGNYSEAVPHFEKAIQLDPQNSWSYHGLGLTFWRLGQAGEAARFFLKAVEVDPGNARYKNDLEGILFYSDHQAEAISNVLTAVRSDPVSFGRFLDAVQFDTNHVGLINNLALSFATNPDAALRNGNYALRLATRSCEMTGFQTNRCLGALAMAYAENSRFEEAISNAQFACSLAAAAGESQRLKQYQELLELFRNHQPYRESVQSREESLPGAQTDNPR
jgi:tetratricopeptide (TPR) repeat protein